MQNDPEFRLFELLHGAPFGSEPHPLTEIPFEVSSRMGWKSQIVYLTKSAAQKIKHHQMHGMDGKQGLQLPMVIKHGDYYQSQKRGSPLQIEVVLHELNNPKRAYFLVLARDKQDKGIFLRTFYFTGKLSRSRMKNARVIFKQSDLQFFK